MENNAQAILLGAKNKSKKESGSLLSHVSSRYLVPHHVISCCFPVSSPRSLASPLWMSPQSSRQVLTRPPVLTSGRVCLGFVCFSPVCGSAHAHVSYIVAPRLSSSILMSWVYLGSSPSVRSCLSLVQMLREKNMFLPESKKGQGRQPKHEESGSVATRAASQRGTGRRTCAEGDSC